MRKNFYCFALSTLFGVTASIGAPQAVSAPVPQNQSAASDGTERAGHRQPDPDRQVKRLAKRLQLTEEQQTQLLPILTERAEQAKGIRSDASLSPADRHSKLRELRRENSTEIRNLLTDSQKSQYDAMLQQAHGRPGGKRHGRNGGSAG